MKPRIHKYADGGKIVAPKKETPRRTGAPPPTRRGDTMRTESVGSTTDSLRNNRRRAMEALGLRDGGRVPLPPKSSRRLPPRSPMPPPEKGPKPKRIGMANGGRVKKMMCGGKVRKS